MAFKNRIIIMNIATRQFLGLVTEKVKIALVYIITWSSVFSLSACSTIFEMDSAIESDPIPEPPQVQELHSSKDTQQPLDKPTQSKQVDETENKTQSTDKISKPVKDKVRAKPVPKAAEKNAAVNRKLEKNKTIKNKALKRKAVKSVAKKTIKKKVPEVEQEKAAAKPEKLAKYDFDEQSSDRDLTTYKVDLATLPMNVGENWVLNRGSDSAEQCALSYRKLVMSDGQGDTPVSIIITKDSAVFKTKSNIDLEYEQTGLTIDDLPQMPIEKLLNDFSISYEQQYQSLIESMKSGEQAILSLGFWPSWPVTHTYSLSFELSDFSSAHHALLSCIALEKELK